MLQISQTENPMCSATIDQMRLRRAINLPLEFQKAWSSGFQSEIQGVFWSLIKSSFRRAAGARARAPGKPRVGGFKNSDRSFAKDGVDGVESHVSSFVPNRIDDNLFIET